MTLWLATDYARGFVWCGKGRKKALENSLNRCVSLETIGGGGGTMLE